MTFSFFCTSAGSEFPHRRQPGVVQRLPGGQALLVIVAQQLQGQAREQQSEQKVYGSGS